MTGRRVFVGRLSYRVRESDVERFFKGFGRINEISMKTGFCFVEFDDIRDAEDAVYEMNNKTLCGDRVTVEHAKGAPRSRAGGYGGGYDRYDRGRDYGGGGRDYRDYRDNNRSRDYGGGGGGGGGSRNSSSKFAPPMRTDYRVIVENLSSRVSWQDLKDYLRDAGEITYADAHTHRRNEGVVDFATYDDMKRAMDKLNNTELKGRKIRLVEDKPSKSYSRSRSRSGSRSRSRSHSRSRSRSRRRSRSRSRSRRRESRSRSRSRRSRSKSEHKDDGSRSRSRSKSKSVNGDGEDRKESKSRSRSPTPEEDMKTEQKEDNEADKKSDEGNRSD